MRWSLAPESWALAQTFPTTAEHLAAGGDGCGSVHLGGMWQGERRAALAPLTAHGQSRDQTMLLKGVQDCVVPTRSPLFLLLQDPTQKQAQVDPGRDVFQAEQAGGAVSFQPSPAPSPLLLQG